MLIPPQPENASTIVEDLDGIVLAGGEDCDPSVYGEEMHPTTEMMLWALRGVTLSRITIDGKPIYHLTPLNAVQKRILVLMEVPLEIYDGLVT